MNTCHGCGGSIGDHFAPDQGGCTGDFRIDGVKVVPAGHVATLLRVNERRKKQVDEALTQRDEAAEMALRSLWSWAQYQGCFRGASALDVLGQEIHRRIAAIAAQPQPAGADPAEPKAPTQHRHGVDCPKEPHRGGGHLHDEHDDRPFDVDGVEYCGRCHFVLDRPVTEARTGRKRR